MLIVGAHRAKEFEELKVQLLFLPPGTTVVVPDTRWEEVYEELIRKTGREDVKILTNPANPDDLPSDEGFMTIYPPGYLYRMIYQQNEAKRVLNHDGLAFMLGGLNAAHQQKIRPILAKANIEYARPFGCLYFKTSEERRQAVILLREKDPEHFGHMWPEIS